MSEKWRILICRFREYMHTQRREGEEGRKESKGGGRVRPRRERNEGDRWIGRKGYKEGRGREARERERERGRVQGLCVSSPLRCRCLPCSFPRSSINETRVQSRRMSNKYVSCLPPLGLRLPSPFRFQPFPNTLTLRLVFLPLSMSRRRRRNSSPILFPSSSF